MRMITNDLIENFKNYLICEEKSKLTTDKYIRDINRFANKVEGVELTKKVVIEYKKTLIDKYAPKSVNSILSSLNALFIYELV